MKLQSILLVSLWSTGGLSVAVRQLNATSSAFGTGTGAIPGPTGLPSDPSPVDTPAKRIIIAVQNPSVVNSVADAIAKADPSAVIVTTWEDKLMPGFVIQSTLSLSTFSNIDGVEHVWPSRKLQPPDPLPDIPSPPTSGNGTGNDTTSASLRARNLKHLSSSSTEPAPHPITRRQDGNATYQADNYSDTIHRMTGVDQLHNEGVLGKGIKVAVVDDGVFYNHSALGGGYGPGFKVVGGHDFSAAQGGEDEDPNPDFPTEGPASFISHGTHIAGIVAGKNDWFSGVAPEANILGYKIYGGGNDVNDDLVIRAWKRAFDDGADVITMSIGGFGAFTDGPVSLLAERLVENGVVVVVSAGNDGYSGPFIANDWCGGPSTICVASVEADTKAGDPVTFNFILDGQNTTAQIGHISPGALPLSADPDQVEPWAWLNTMDVYSNIHGKPVPVISLGDACKPIDPVEADPTQTVFLVGQAGCTMEQKVENLTPLNPAYVLFYADPLQSLWMRPGLFPGGVGYGLIEKEAGDAILSVLNAGGQVTATYANNDNAVGIPAKNPRGGIASLFTSWGGTYELALKPDIAAPGGDIFSTFVITQLHFGEDGPVELYGPLFHTLNGTSMATPYIAGVAALHLSKHGGRATKGPGVARDVVNRIKGSGDQVPWGMEPYWSNGNWDDPRNPNPIPDRENAVAPVMQVGTGIVNAVKVVNYQSSITSGGNMALNDTVHFKDTHEIVITNAGPDALTYEFSHDKQLASEARIKGQELIANYTNNWMIELSPEITFPTGTFSVAAGESKTATIKFAAPSPTDTTKWPFYNGRVVITSSKNETLAAQYMGAAFDLKKEVGSLWPTTPVPVETTSSSNTDFVFVWNNGTEVNQVTINFQLKWGTKFIRLDMFVEDFTEQDWTWPPERSPKYAATATMFNRFGEAPVNIYRSHTYARLDPGPQEFLWQGGLESGNLTAGTQYRPRFAALRPFGDPTVAGDWTVWTEAPVINIVKVPASQ